ncbi:MAG TPA: DUF3800 domain-containing protein [Brevundimonas sp.]|nr:DUF3800 domain-containing protein [Brevundimonas sp.]
MADFDKYHVFCDESATSERYTVIGVLVCHESVTDKFTAWLDTIVAKGRPTTELKWQKVKKHNVDIYCDVAAAVLTACHKGYASYYAIVVDNSTMNHRLYNEGDKEIGFNKMLFQILYKLIRIYRSRPLFYAHLDYRTTKHTPERLKTMLNAKASRDLRIRHNPFRTCQFRQSHDVRLIQAVDVITGAIAYRTNQHDMAPDAAAAKVKVMRHITDKLGLRTLGRPTPSGFYVKRKFDIWHIDLTARAGGVKK